MQGGQSKAKKENKAKQAKKRIKQAQRKNKPKIQKTTKYSNKFVSKSVLPHYPAPLQSLHKTKYMGLAYHELLNLCGSQEVSMTKEQTELVEGATKCQSKSKLWFKYQAGCITASQMKSVCHTDAASPSQSLLKSICYPEAYSFFSKQTVWGCKHKGSVFQENGRTTHKLRHIPMTVVWS